MNKSPGALLFIVTMGGLLLMFSGCATRESGPAKNPGGESAPLRLLSVWSKGGPPQVSFHTGESLPEPEIDLLEEIKDRRFSFPSEDGQYIFFLSTRFLKPDTGPGNDRPGVELMIQGPSKGIPISREIRTILVEFFPFRNYPLRFILRGPEWLPVTTKIDISSPATPSLLLGRSRGADVALEMGDLELDTIIQLKEPDWMAFFPFAGDAGEYAVYIHQKRGKPTIGLQIPKAFFREIKILLDSLPESL